MTLPPIVVNELEKQSGLILIEPSDASINTLIEQIKQRTGELISINTVKRLLGRVDDGNRQPRISTLNTIARYLGRSGWTPLLLELSNGSSCTLFVPKGSVEAYQQAPYWQDFAEIKAIE